MEAFALAGRDGIHAVRMNTLGSARGAWCGIVPEADARGRAPKVVPGPLERAVVREACVIIDCSEAFFGLEACGRGCVTYCGCGRVTPTDEHATVLDCWIAGVATLCLLEADVVS